jgi:hypothetical protein
MSDHQLKFKGPGFDFDAKGWMAIGAAIVIVLLVLLVPRLFYSVPAGTNARISAFTAR